MSLMFQLNTVRAELKFNNNPLNDGALSSLFFLCFVNGGSNGIATILWYCIATLQKYHNFSVGM